METIMNFLDRPSVMLVIGIVASYLIAKLLKAKPAWEAWTGPIIEAIKFAERTIPNGSPNQSLLRLDKALQYVLNIYAARNGVEPPTTFKDMIRDAIPIVHADLEADGNLEPTAAPKPKDPTLPGLLLIPLLLSSMFLGGCTLFSKDQKAELLAARHTYAGVVNVLTIARRQGMFTKSQGEMIGRHVDLGADVLNKWEAQIRLGNSTSTVIQQWQEILLELTAAQVMAEQSKPSAPPTPTPTNSVPYEDPFNPVGAEQEPQPPRVVMAGVDPASVLGFLTLLMAFGVLGEQLTAILRRLISGEAVTEEEMTTAKRADDNAQAAYHAAGKFDKPDLN